MRRLLWRRPMRLFLLILVSAALVGMVTICLHQDTHSPSPPTSWSGSHQTEYVDRRGIHVVVGHYMGDNLPWVTSPNLTEAILNANMYNPEPGAGELGHGVVIPSYDMRKMQKLYQINRFNLMASDRISINRSLPDVRKKKCLEHDYNIHLLPNTSVIIVFHNEAWSTLLRTVQSVINRSPKQLITEILLVDDASRRSFLNKPLEDYLSKLPVTAKLLRSSERIGLIKARLLGARAASGTTITFLDAHCECTQGWLEPLLERIGEDRRRIVSPVIDIISEDTFAYVRSFEMDWGAFNWGLLFRWFTLGTEVAHRRRTHPDQPFKSPVMAGGLFAINKEYFFEMGAYDEDMEIWGGENLEISFRNWMCGGSLEIVPCSHVGHLFRRSSPYTFPSHKEGISGVNSILYGNLARVALVWMDQWKEFFFKLNPEANRHRDDQSVAKRLELREKLQCKGFEWYLDNVWTQHFLPKDDRFLGKLRNKKTSKCLQSPKQTNGVIHPSEALTVAKCVIEIYASQLYIWHPNGYIMTDESLCLDVTDLQSTTAEPQPRLIICTQIDRQKWTYVQESGQIRHRDSSLCLDLPTSHTSTALTLQQCGKGLSQKWTLENVSWK